MIIVATVVRRDPIAGTCPEELATRDLISRPSLRVRDGVVAQADLVASTVEPNPSPLLVIPGLTRDLLTIGCDIPQQEAK
jgi:hypothetical protein